MPMNYQTMYKTSVHLLSLNFAAASVKSAACDDKEILL